MGGSTALTDVVAEKPKALTADRIAKAVGIELRELIAEMWPPLEPEPEPHEQHDHIVYGAQPAAGGDYRFQVTYPSYPLAVYCRVTTDGTAGTRSVAVEYRTGDGARFIIAGSAVTLAPSQQQSFNWHPALFDR